VVQPAALVPDYHTVSKPVGSSKKPPIRFRPITGR